MDFGPLFICISFILSCVVDLTYSSSCGSVRGEWGGDKVPSSFPLLGEDGNIIAKKAPPISFTDKCATQFGSVDLTLGCDQLDACYSHCEEFKRDCDEVLLSVWLDLCREQYKEPDNAKRGARSEERVCLDACTISVRAIAKEQAGSETGIVAYEDAQDVCEKSHEGMKLRLKRWRRDDKYLWTLVPSSTAGYFHIVSSETQKYPNEMIFLNERGNMQFWDYWKDRKSLWKLETVDEMPELVTKDRYFILSGIGQRKASKMLQNDDGQIKTARFWRDLENIWHVHAHPEKENQFWIINEGIEKAGQDMIYIGDKKLGKRKKTRNAKKRKKSHEDL